jgi:NAD(P)H-dependent FMN reductase
MGRQDRLVRCLRFRHAEYNHGTSGALKNAIDFLFAEWNNKAAGFVSYGGASGARAVEQLRLNLAEVQMATVRNQILLSLYTDFENFSVFKPGPTKEQSVNEMLDQLIAWGGALKTLDLKVEDALPDLRGGFIALGTGSSHSKTKSAVCFVF